MIFRGVGTHNQDHISITDVRPVVGHSSAPETLRQTGDGGGMSYPGLSFRVYYTEGTIHFGDEVTFLVIVG